MVLDRGWGAVERGLAVGLLVVAALGVPDGQPEARGLVDGVREEGPSLGVTPWLRYPEFAELGYGTKAVITPTRSGLPAGGTYAIDGALPPGLAFDTRTGIISGVAKINDGIVYEPTVTAVGADGKAQVSTRASITVIKPAVPMQVIARAATTAVKAGTTVLVARVRHPNYASLSAKVTCKACTSVFTPSTGKLVVKLAKGTTSVTVRIVASPIGAKAKVAFAGHAWSRTWRVTK